MDLDTSAKKFKYSFLNKLICILLSVITFAGATGLTTMGVMTLSYIYDNKDTVNKEWYQTNEFRWSFIDKTRSVADEVTHSARETQLKKQLDNMKEEIVDDAYTSFCKGFDQMLKDCVNSDYSKDDYESFIYETDYENFFYERSIDISSLYTDNSFSVTISYDCQNPKKEIENLYDNYVNESHFNFSGYNQYYDFSNIEDYKFYVSGNNTIYNNTDSNTVDESSILKKDIYYIRKNGKIQSKGIESELLSSINALNDEFTTFEEYDIYIYIDLDVDNDIFSIGNNKFLDLSKFHTQAVKFYKGFAGYALLDLILIVTSIILGFYYFSIAGKKSENEKAKLAFIDYIPVELHIACTGGLIVGAIILICALLSGDLVVYYSDIIILIFVAGVCVCQLLLIELIASFVRLVKSGREAKKSFLLYYIFYALFVVFRADFRFMKKLNKKISTRIKKTVQLFTYKPQRFQIITVFFMILYFFVNLLLPIFITFLLVSDCTALSLLIILADIVGNAFVIRKVFSYIKNLDIIIASSEKHEDIALDIDALPKSLATLAQSMKYTNAELQEAVNKAVKDERLRTELITNVSHDLKTPLTSIITYVDLLSKCDIDDKKAQEYIKILDEKGARLKRLIDDLVEASKVTSGNIKFNPINLNLSELCLQSTVDAQESFEKQGLDLIIKQGEKSPIIFADGPKTFRIIENLLSNARKYSAKGSRVYTSVYQEYGWGVFEIKNISAQPLDISPDELTERFVRGDKSRNQDGNGLGLSIAKELCKAQNGELEIIIDGDLFKAKVKLPLA